MKKIISLILALVLVLGLATVASAKTYETNPESGEEAWPTTNTVTESNVVKVIMDTADPIPVYKVDVQWESLEFKYTAGDEATASWNPDTHTYIAASEAKWDKTSAKITVTNHSSEAISVAATMDKTSANGVTASLTNASFDLDSAIGTAVDEAPYSEITVGISGAPETNTVEFEIGTVTVAVTPKAA